MFQATFVDTGSKRINASNIDFVVNSERKCYVTSFRRKHNLCVGLRETWNI